MNAQTDILAAMRADAAACNARLARVNGRLPQHADHRAEKPALGPASARYLSMIARAPRTRSDIAKGLGVSLPAVSFAMKPLLAAGMVRAKRSGHLMVVEITPAGLAWIADNGGEA